MNKVISSMQARSLFRLSARFFGSTPLLLVALRTNTKEVELTSEFIPANNTAEVSKHMLFAHGILGRGRNWRPIASDQRVLVELQ